ncbi:MAG TPA: hypothetical protein VJX67_19985 [Blastocatellia bacterium]|nr:hypothetical protein [Blastocatellia bacterium]
MSTQSLTMEIHDEAARLFRASSLQEQKKMEALISIWLKDFATSYTRPLTGIVRDIGEGAAERGLTAEVFSSVSETE